jgi:hypothetical protein
MLRFLPSWVDLGTISCGPTSRRLKVADLTLPEGADTLWVRVAQVGGTSPWPFGYGLLSFQSDSGRELGTVKVYGHQEGETYRLGTGIEPVQRAGALCFEPRSYNLKWLETSGTSWVLSFSFFAGTSGGGGGVGAFAGGFVDPVGTGLTLARVVFP